MLFRSVGIYFSKKKETVLLENDPASGIHGLINDIDGGLPIWPYYCSDDNELVGILKAEDMKELLTEKYFSTREVKDAEAQQRLKKLVKNLKEEDNPVIMFAKLKD